MPRVGFEPAIQVFKREKTVHALDRAATVIGENIYIYPCINENAEIFKTLKIEELHKLPGNVFT
jgi:hypothetical protein